MTPRLDQMRAKPTHLVMGLMSGTSADGVDAALCELSGEGRGGLKVRLVAQHSQDHPDFLRDRILSACEPKGGNSGELCELNFLIGEAFAFAANALIDASGVPREQIDLIGSHGQTVSHLPPRTEAHTFQAGSTLQLGEAGVIAERTGIPVVSNFRTRDIAAGGQGAPLVPFVDFLLFSSGKTRVALNIGGISNLTWLPANGTSEQTVAYDTGPGNMVVDAVVQYLTEGEESFDRGGAMALSGTVDNEFLNEMLRHDYLQRSPPKSTGREEFGVDFAMKLYEQGRKRSLAPRDIVATATEFTARTIADSVKRFLLPRGAIDEIIVSGGGALNPALMQHLARDLPDIALLPSDRFGLPVKSKESVAFAILARETVLGRPGNLPSATGAAGARILGQVTPA